MKKVLFTLIVIVLAGGAWYMDKTMNQDSAGGSNFEKAMQIMKNLQSSAIPVVLTDSELATLEAGYQDALVRKPQITAFRDADLATLTQKLIAAGLTGIGTNDPQTRIIDLATGLVDDYNPKNSTGTFITPNPITVLINTNLANSTQAVKDDIKKIADSVNRLTNDVLITNLFISQYGSLRPNLCTKTADPTNNQYVPGEVTLRYQQVAPIADSCTGNTLTERKCSNLKYTTDTDYNISTTCEFGCNAGACKKGTLGTVSIVDAGTANGLPITDVKANQTFFLKVTPTRAYRATATVELSASGGTTAKVISGGLGYTTAPVVIVSPYSGTCTTKPTARATITDTSVSSIKLIGGNCTVAPTLSIDPPTGTTTLTAVVDPSTCTLASNLRTQAITNTGTTLYFGPITCGTVNTGTDQTTLNIALKDGTQTVETVAKPLSIGGVTMSKFEITAPTNVAAGNDFTITVKTVGTNNIPYTSYTDDFFIVVEGDDDAVFPKGPQKMPAGGAEKTISGIKFSNRGAVNSGGNIKITVRGTGVTDTAEKSIIVTGADLGIRENTGEYVKDITLDAGKTFNYKWNSVNGTTYSSSHTCIKFNGTACAGDASWIANTAAGQNASSVLSAAYKGYIWTITYKVRKTVSGVNYDATDTIVFRVNE